jgi:hypothetical protein
VPGSPHGTPPRRAFSLTCFADHDAAHRHNPDPDPRRPGAIGSERTAGPSGGQAGRAGPAECVRFWERIGSGDPAPDAVRSRQTRRVDAMSTRLTCGNAPEQGSCKHSRSVRDEETIGQVRHPARKLRAAVADRAWQRCLVECGHLISWPRTSALPRPAPREPGHSRRRGESIQLTRHTDWCSAGALSIDCAPHHDLLRRQSFLARACADRSRALPSPVLGLRTAGGARRQVYVALWGM